MPLKAKRALRRKQLAKKQPPSLLILGGIALLLIAVFALKSVGNTLDSTVSLETQLDQALQQGRPTFVFLHSMECIPCKAMINVVEQVYPEFQNSVVLIDVDVYDQSNTNILRRENLRSIPTLVFYNGNGNRQVHIGVMEPDQFRQTLGALTAGQ